MAGQVSRDIGAAGTGSPSRRGAGSPRRSAAPATTSPTGGISAAAWGGTLPSALRCWASTSSTATRYPRRSWSRWACRKYKTGGSWGGYVIGGGGFSRQLTSFTEPALAQGVYCSFFYCYPVYYQTTVVVSHYSSNQGALNLGTGFTFGNWNQAKLFAEARYEWLDTPGRSTQIIPVTFGLRW